MTIPMTKDGENNPAASADPAASRNPAGSPNPAELTLDPTTAEDWEAMRQLGHRMVDDMLDSLRTVRDRPVFNPIPDAIKQGFGESVPRTPESPSKIYEQFTQTILPYPHGNTHPRFWGWVVGTGTPLGMLADMLAAGINSNAGFGDNSANHVESQVVRWLQQALGFSPECSGILVSGCSVANLAALTVARNSVAGWDVRTKGVQAGERLTVYGSIETHSSNHRALELLGLGRESFREVAVDEECRIHVTALRELIESDRKCGMRPIAVIANAGTVNTGAFDDLEQLADVCAEEKIWLHVDGAFGSMAALSPELSHNVKGLDRADSVAFDLHKWLHVPYDVGGVLIRDRVAHNDTFRMSGAYIQKFESRLASGPTNFMEHGVQMSRGFRALKAWMTIKEHGTVKLGQLVHQNVVQARYLAGLVDDSPDLERVAPVPLNIVCFRYVAPGQSEEQIDDLNKRILRQLHESGIAAPSYTVLDGRFVLRAAITNHRSLFEDFELLVREVVAIGKREQGEKSRGEGSGRPS